MGRFDLFGIGLYTTAEAQRLLGIPSGKIARWLRGHDIAGKHYAPLWRPQVDLGDGAVYLGFRDLMEMRTAHEFMAAGVSAQAVRRAIQEARRYVDDDRPLSTTAFRTDGRTIFLEIAGEDGDTKLLDLFRRQYAFKQIMERSLKDVEFDNVSPARWWVASKQSGIVIDPERSFGQPIEASSGVPTAVLAQAVKAEGGIKAAARAWMLKPAQVQRAVAFEAAIDRKAA